eukprot:scaffold4595_cov267-Chaetoceros_neogracile.AAC.16
MPHRVSATHPLSCSIGGTIIQNDKKTTHNKLRLRILTKTIEDLLYRNATTLDSYLQEITLVDRVMGLLYWVQEPSPSNINTKHQMCAFHPAA